MALNSKWYEEELQLIFFVCGGPKHAGVEVPSVLELNYSRSEFICQAATHSSVRYIYQQREGPIKWNE